MKSILYVTALIGATRALDVSIEEVICDTSLDVTATLQMECNGGSRCAFGSTSRIFGTIYYNGVSYSGIQNNQAYVSAELKFLTLDYKPLDMKTFQLCNENLVQAENSQSGDCPADGSYTYSIPYKLPAAGAGHPVWLASGFQGTGIVRMYAAQDERMLIGECHLKLKTYVTRTEKNTYGPLSIPSAAVSLGMASALMTLIGLCCCYSHCCIRRKINVQDAVSENEALFTRMEDDKPVVVRTTATNRPIINVSDVQHLPDTEKLGNVITEVETPRQEKPLRIPLM